MVQSSKKFNIFLCTIFTIVILLSPQTSFSATVDELKDKINQTLQDKEQLEKEIAQYEVQLKSIGQQASSLSNAIKSLDATINKNVLNIRLTQNNINSAELQIEELSLEISKSVDIINQDTKAIRRLIIETDRIDNVSLIENLFGYKSISELWVDLENMYIIQNQLREKVIETKDTKKVLEDNKIKTENKRQELIGLRSNLQDQKKILEISKGEKNTLLKDTKATEANYKKILDEKKALSLAFDKELLEFQSALKFAIDPSSYPLTGKGILSWPLDIVRITQKFGVTDFSKTTTAYNGKGHNGVDFGTAIGTPIKSVLSGTVVGVGDTDLVCPGASFGRWVFIQHDNGLSTTYAHLSLIKAKKGDRVQTGTVIGYSGNTGFSTGPHLHLSLYISQGVKILSRKSSVCGGTYTMPIADLRAYLDPLRYL
jgi:murein DD-endopeptidase MepM/ murein hydrolase activator NlpD